MKKLLLLIPFCLFAFASKYTLDLNNIVKNLHCTQVLHKKVFDICYNCSYKEPNAVAYTLTKQMEDGRHYSKKWLYFHIDYNLPHKCRAYPSDYTHSGYDRGHHAPNAAFNYNRSIQKETFLMSNISPQAKWLNRKYWARVESFVSHLAIKYGKVEVITGNCSSKGHLKWNVNIPAYWYKIIYIPKLNKTLAFLAPNMNTGMKTAKIKKYQTKVQIIEKVCGF